MIECMHESWRPFLQAEFQQDYFRELSEFLRVEYAHKTIFPPKNQVFSAFATDFNAIKVVIIGQDPYHEPGQAHGLAFSVRPGVKMPPSLQNIFKEINAELGTPLPTDGYLGRWARQGVLLLNNTLTVEAHKAGSHRGHSWEVFTTHTIEHLSAQREHLVFMLWGRDARSKKTLIDQDKHLILEAAHPSPLSAYHGFFGCGHFTACNDYLRSHGLTPIDW
ncbi:uracil-DNA glycosylase [bacterium]|nr:uracil-DNA glycosylase [bacterium]